MTIVKKPKPLPLDKLSKVKAKLGDDTVKEMEALTPTELDKKISTATKAIEEAKDERDENEGYQEAKQTVSDFNSGFNDVKKRQNATIALARHLLAEKGM